MEDFNELSLERLQDMCQEIDPSSNLNGRINNYLVISLAGYMTTKSKKASSVA